MTQEYSEIDIAANDAIQIRQEVEGVVEDILSRHLLMDDEVRTRLTILLNITRVHEARMTGMAQGQRILSRFSRRLTVGRDELREMKEFEQLYSETLKAAEQMVSDVRLVSIKKEHQPTRRTR